MASQLVFTKKYWHLVGDKFSVAIINLLNGQGSWEKINATLLCLIPKKKNLVNVVDYRPISLCNVFCKLCYKVLANRLKPILPSVISQFQSAFVANRLISDNFLVAYETLNFMATKMKGRGGYMALKLDMSKAYDRMEWPFIESVLNKMGFPSSWISSVMRWLNYVSYSVLVNGIPSQKFFPSRGLHQGDPISPYIFILCAEVLSSALLTAGQNGSLHRVPIGRDGFRLNNCFC